MLTAMRSRNPRAQCPSEIITRCCRIVPNRKRRCYQRRLVHLRVEPAHFDWHWRERPALALLAWEAQLAIRWRGYAASKWSQLELQLILGQRLSPIARSSISLADRIQARADGGSGCV